MTVVLAYAAFRQHFATVARTTGVSLTYDHTATPNTVARVSGSFVTDGFVAGMSLDVANTTANDARYTIATVSALSMTITEQFNTSETITSSLTGATYYTDGYETWPRALVRSGGFSDSWSFAPAKPITVFPVAITVNAAVTDAVAGTSYTWYVRQRTDDPALQWIAAAHASPATTTGTVRLTLTSRCVTDLDLASATAKLTAAQQRRILRNVWIFCKRHSDGAIQQADLWQLSHATVL